MTAEGNPFLGLEHRRPAVDAAEAGRLLQVAFGLTGTLRELGSHQDRNFLVEAPAGRFVLKVARHGISRGELDAENRAMLAAAAAGLPFATPVPQPALDGSLVARAMTTAGATHDLRLVSWIEGQPLDRAGHLAPPVLRAHGEMAAGIARALADVDHPALDRAFQWDVRHAGSVVPALLPFVRGGERGALAERSLGRALHELRRLEPGLRVRTIHADVTDLNTVARRDAAGRPMPVGLIDFGDLSRTWLAAELAVTVAADAFHDLAHPLQLAREVAAGFLPLLPLHEAELEAVWPMVVARSSAVAVSGDHQAALEPDNAYVQATRDEEWAALAAVAAVPFPLAAAVMREAAGLGPRRGASLPGPRAPILSRPPGSPDAAVLDLSTTSDVLPGAATGDPGAVAGLVEAAGGWAVGRWGEGRLVDARPDAIEEAPSVHLGVDLFAPAGTAVTAPVAGTVQRVPGGCLLEAGGWRLRLDGLSGATERSVGAGDVLGTVAPDGPDGLPPHLHVQWIPGSEWEAPGSEPAGSTGDPAGSTTHAPRAAVPPRDSPPRDSPPRAAVPSLAAAWLSLCPDPGPVAGIPLSAAAPPDDPRALLERRRRVLAGVQAHYYAAPPRVERGWRHHLVDASGRARIDIVNNVAVLGHSHPAVEEAVRRQLARLNTNSRFLYGAMVDFAEALVARFPPPLDTVLLVNTGSEANELALRLARTATGARDVLSIRGAYHGWTLATDAVSTCLLDNPAAVGTRPGWVHPVEAPNPFRGRFRGPDAGSRYADDVRATVARLRDAGRRPAAFIAEPLFGNAGGVVLPDGYLAEAYAAVRAAGGLAIADEVQTGYGRLGEVRWAFEQQGVVPDLVSLAKAAGNGIAVGAVVTTRAIADAFAAEGTFFSSVGGSPVGCAAGLAVLETLDREGLQANAREVGGYLRDGLRELASAHPIVGAVHGMGLYLGVELVRDPGTLEPAAEEAAAICERLLDLGVIVQPTGDGNNVLKVKPPLCFSRASADAVLAALERTLSGGW